MRSALEFFATAQSCRERSLLSVYRVTEFCFSGVSGFFGIFRARKVQNFTASFSSSELSAHQMAPGGVIAH